MAKAKYTYNVETYFLDEWVAIIKNEKRDFCMGYFIARLESPSPNLEYRVIRSDGKILDSFKDREHVSLGQIAGFPTPVQYERAAENAMECARVLRMRNKKFRRLDNESNLRHFRKMKCFYYNEMLNYFLVEKHGNGFNITEAGVNGKKKYLDYCEFNEWLKDKTELNDEIVLRGLHSYGITNNDKIT